MIYTGVDNAYIKAGFYCLVWRQQNKVIKFPTNRIFRIIEPYDPED
jgi:hypothetical protein